MRKILGISTLAIMSLAVVLLMAPAAGASDDATLGRTLYNLGEQGNAKAEPVLKAHLTDQNVHIRRIAAHALGKIGSPESVATLIKIADNPGEAPIVRCSAVKALGRMGAKQARASLTCLCKHPNRMIQAAAVASLDRLDVGY